MRALLLLAVLVVCPSVYAQEPVLIDPREPQETPRLILDQQWLAAYQDYRQAYFHMQQYRHTVLPEQRRFLDEQIELTEKEIEVLRRRLRDYRPFLRVDEYSPVRTAAESYELELLAAEQSLRHLKDKRIALMRTKLATYRHYQLEALEAAQRLLAIQRSLEAQPAAVE